MAQSEEQKVRHMIAKLLWYEYICRVLCHCSLINWYTLINDTIKCWKSKRETTKKVVTITTKLDKNSPSNKLLTTVYIQDSKNNKHTSTHYSRTLVLLLFFPRRVSSQESSNISGSTHRLFSSQFEFMFQSNLFLNVYTNLFPWTTLHSYTHP